MKTKYKDPEVITLGSNMKKLKAIRSSFNNKVPSAVLDKMAYLLPSLDIQPYIEVNKEGVIILEYGREDGSFLNFYIYDEPQLHMVFTLMASDGKKRFVRALVEPRECNKRINMFYSN